MMGNVLITLLRQGGLTALIILALVNRKAELEIGLAYLIIESSMVLRLLAAPYVDVAWRKRFLTRWMGVASLCSVLLLLVPAVGLAGHGEAGLWVLLAVLVAFFSTTFIAAAAWFPLLHAILPASLRGRYFGNMRRAWQLVGFGTVFLSGLALGRDPGIGRFYLVLVPAVILQLGRVWKYAQLPDPPPAQAERNGTAFSSMTSPLGDLSFRRFLGFVILTAVAQAAAVPFVVPFLKSELGFPASLTLFGTGSLGLGSVLSLIWWGRLADRWGARLAFLLGSLISGGAFAVVASVPMYDRGPLVAGTVAFVGLLFAGVGTAGIGIAYTVRLMQMVPQENSSSYLNITQAAFGLAGGLSAALVGALLQWLPARFDLLGWELRTFRALFLVVAMGLGSVLLLRRHLPRMGEPRLRQAGSAAVSRMRSMLPWW